MAEKDKKMGLADYLNVSPAAFGRWMRGQQNQYNPMIRTLSRQLRNTRVGADPMVQAYERLMGGLPSAESIAGAYSTADSNLANIVRGTDFGAAGRGVSDVISGIGSALGVEGAADIAGASNTVSGGDVFSRAIAGGLAANLAGQRTERMRDVEGQRQQFTLGAAEARKAVMQQRQDMARMLAEAKGQRRGARANPLDTAGSVMNYLSALRSYNQAGSGRGSFSGGGVADTAPPTPTDLGQLLAPGMSKRDFKRMWNTPAAGGQR